MEKDKALSLPLRNGMVMMMKCIFTDDENVDDYLRRGHYVIDLYYGFV